MLKGLPTPPQKPSSDLPQLICTCPLCSDPKCRQQKAWSSTHQHGVNQSLDTVFKAGITGRVTRPGGERLFIDHLNESIPCHLSPLLPPMRGVSGSQLRELQHSMLHGSILRNLQTQRFDPVRPQPSYGGERYSEKRLSMWLWCDSTNEKNVTGRPSSFPVPARWVPSDSFSLGLQTTDSAAPFGHHPSERSLIASAQAW